MEKIAEDERTAISTLQEIFSLTITEAENSYRYYKNNLSDAINGLASRHNVSLDQMVDKSHLEDKDKKAIVATCSPNPSTSSGGETLTAGTTTSNPIDLTQDDDLQKALALSLQDMQHQNGGISFEEQELSRALEASIAETHVDDTGTRRIFIDPLNPHEKVRKNDDPVGLKNIGNTCWFSAVMQVIVISITSSWYYISLFFLSSFLSLSLSPLSLFSFSPSSYLSLSHCLIFQFSEI
jgi:hypothetical protein